MAELAAFHFLRPGLLYWLLPCALYGLYLVSRSAVPSAWRAAISPALLPHLLHAAGPRRWLTPESLLLGAAVLATLAAAGPSFAARGDNADPKDSRLIVVFELSQSMNRRDVSPSRAQRARLALLDLLHQRPESPTALVVVAGSAHVLMPFSDDGAALEPSIKALSPELMPSDGQAFEQAARRVVALAHEGAPPPAVLLVSDGMPPGGVEAFARLHHEQGLGLIILGVGHDDDSLERLATRGDAALIELSFAARDTPRLLSAIAQTRAHVIAPGDARFWRDDGPWLALPLALAIAMWFRRGWVLRPILLSTLALASAACSPAIEGIWLSPNQQGRLRFDRGDYLEAAARFQDPLWRGLSFYAAEKWDDAARSFAAVDGPVGLFNLGNAYAQGGKLESALESYDRGLRLAPTDRKLRKNRDKIRQLLRSLQEDTEPEGAKGEERYHGDRAAKLSPDELGKKLDDAPRTAARTDSGGEPIEERVWLARMSTDPSEFLRRKLALQAARGDAP
jgi:Ca-activated chloride channel family protein